MFLCRSCLRRAISRRADDGIPDKEPHIRAVRQQLQTMVGKTRGNIGNHLAGQHGVLPSSSSSKRTLFKATTSCDSERQRKIIKLKSLLKQRHRSRSPLFLALKTVPYVPTTERDTGSRSIVVIVLVLDFEATRSIILTFSDFLQFFVLHASIHPERALAGTINPQSTATLQAPSFNSEDKVDVEASQIISLSS